MPAILIDGKAYAVSMRSNIATYTAELKANHGVVPGLAVVLAGDNPASHVYVRNKRIACEEAGMASFDFHLPVDTSLAQLIAQVKALNADPRVHGILVQLPLPRPEEEQAIIQTIAPEKDVDGFHVINAGKLATGDATGMVPCTPLGCMLLLHHYAEHLRGKNAVVLGRSNIVGKPMQRLLLDQNCTVTTCHSATPHPEYYTREADIVIAAVGRPKLVTADWIKPGAMVIDVGINRITQPDGKEKLVGDVDFDSVKEVAGALTPVPGGVGPMTIACLLYNTLKAACQQHGLPMPVIQ